MSTNNKYNDFNLPIDGYAAFDALSLKNLIVKRLNSTGDYTDQRFEGSNLSSIIDIIAYAYHVLLFYLNRTSAESTFTTAELFENVNKIVKLIGYNPIGVQTAILPFKASSNANLLPDTYTIPRYSYFNVNGKVYSFNSDITFTKTTSDTETLTDLQDNNLLYQGSYTEYPSYFATGAPFETLILTVVDPNGNNITIDHFNIDVYVKSSLQGSKWEKWLSTQSLFLEKSNATKYEIRLNESGRYEIKFGNNITGKQLDVNSEVAVYYIQSNGIAGEVGPSLLDGRPLFFYSTARFNNIKADTISPNLKLITSTEASNITFKNVDSSTKFVERESVESIKANAPNTFRSQFRLITSEDFINYINKNYSNIIASTQVVNNWDYISGHLKYYFDLGVAKPNIESRVLFNQVKFADSSNFNNVYVYAVPKLVKTSSVTTRTNYLNNAQKQLLLNDLQDVKLTTAELIVNDPVYVEVDLGVKSPSETLTPSIGDDTFLVINRSVTSKKDATLLKQLVSETIINYFATTKDNLGLLVSITDLTNQILAIDGVTNVTTQRTIDGQVYTIPGISLLIYNPIYPYNDINIFTQNVKLPYFKYPYLKDSLNFINKVVVVTPSIQSLIKEY
ncbi:baseplate wedge subunit [uncultured Caudovirales phage]|uniref:Baseplate wedge subunit n=1 Tax=uncultured Caudovirales phage TaxID=2100421 RepID=A0A6J7XBT0_9CAUD|nr:baseplate wedge subunit [uncultured Caudovirales phage]